MKKVITLIIAVLTIFNFVGHVSAHPVEVEVTYTADNITGSWFQNGGSPTSLPLGPNANEWWNADTQTLNLDINHNYQLIWQTKNSSSSSSGPGGFLAEITSPVPIEGSSLLSSANWEIFVQYGSLETPANFDLLAWSAATEWGQNNGSAFWRKVAGIHDDAQWIWGPDNFDMPKAPGPNDAVFIRAMVHPTPVPSAMLLLSTGLLGLEAIRRTRRKKKAQT